MQKRWYDMDPSVSLAVSLLENADEKLQLECADYIIEKAIENHNKLEIAENLASDELLFTKMIRDMDKVDIYKQVAIKYEIHFDAKEIDLKKLKNSLKQKKLMKI